MLPPHDQRALFSLCRAAIRAQLLGEQPPDLPSGSAVLEQVRGVFVTLRMRSDGALRGCIGHTVGREPLARGVRSLAVAAAFRDRRFSPLTLDELPRVRVELSILSPLSRADLEAIEIGVHGLLIRHEASTGLLLPQVASERGWSPSEFLEHTCIKAGLPGDAYKEQGAEVLWFTSTCYEETAPRSE